MDEIAEAAAVAGAEGGLPLGLVSEAADQLMGVGEGGPIGQVNMITQRALPTTGL